MLEGRTLLAVVPARGGSKSVPLKNLQPVLGVPLIQRTGQIVAELGYFDRAIVSTDHPEIAKAAMAGGLDAPFYRPEALSGDLVSDHEVVYHALQELERIDSVRYDVIVLLQPTSPLRRPIHVTSVILKLIQEAWDAVWTVSPTDAKYHPLKQLRVGPSAELEYYDQAGSQVIARQQLGPVYHRNGAAYALTRDCILEQTSLMGRRTGALLIDEPMVSIDTHEDIKLVERLLLEREGSV